MYFRHLKKGIIFNHHMIKVGDTLELVLSNGAEVVAVVRDVSKEVINVIMPNMVVELEVEQVKSIHNLSIKQPKTSKY